MICNKKRMVALILLGTAIFTAGTAFAETGKAAATDQLSIALPQYPNVYNNYLQPVATAIDYYTGNLYLINYDNDKVIIIDPTSLSGWPGNVHRQL